MAAGFWSESHAAVLGYTLRVTAFPAVLDRCQRLDGGQGAPAVPAQPKARREYENRVSTLTS